MPWEQAMKEMNVSEVYAFVKLLESRSDSNHYQELSNALKEAQESGNSGLEILGAIKDIFLRKEKEIKGFLRRRNLLK
jgi:thermostable 8-oxoguanine DNA glycosylase